MTVDAGMAERSNVDGESLKRCAGEPTDRSLHTGAAGSCLRLMIFGSGTIPNFSQGGEPC
jgi:hypothetical protein